jgi:hypothetical protein
MGFVHKLAFKNARETIFLKSGKARNAFRLDFKKFFLGFPMVAGRRSQPLSYE